ncbi:MAG: guanylate kinase [Ktedonobacterales bacterium]
MTTDATEGANSGVGLASQQQQMTQRAQAETQRTMAAMKDNPGDSGSFGNPFLTQHYPLLVVLSGPSGVGKTTLTNALMAEGWPARVMVTATTRRPRAGEIDGVHYHFRTAEQFAQMIAQGELLEHAEVHGNHYGVPAGTVRETLAAGHDALLTIDPQGAQSIRERTSDAVFVFLAPESLDELVTRLDTRGLDTPEQRALRLINAECEMAQAVKYDYLIVNRRDRLAESVNNLKAIITAEHCRAHPRRATV